MISWKALRAEPRLPWSNSAKATALPYTPEFQPVLQIQTCLAIKVLPSDKSLNIDIILVLFLELNSDWLQTQQEYWIGLPFPSPGDPPRSRIKLVSPALETCPSTPVTLPTQARSLMLLGLSLCQEPLPMPTCQKMSTGQPGLSFHLLHEAFPDFFWPATVLLPLHSDWQQLDHFSVIFLFPWFANSFFKDKKCPFQVLSQTFLAQDLAHRYNFFQ